MDGVTDHPYRYIQKKYGNPDVVYTEFTSVEGVCHGADRLLQDFLFDETQRPIVAQIYGTTPQFFRETATLLCQLGFDGIDINMGCPAKNVAHSGAGAALITTPDLAKTIVTQTKAGVTDWAEGKSAINCSHISETIAKEVQKRHTALPAEYQSRNQVIPVSVKTRIGYDKPMAAEWVQHLLEVEPAVIALHGRTLKQQYSGLADWDEIARAAEVIKHTNTLVFGNGDTKNRNHAVELSQKYNIDGVLIGRSSFGNPYVFLPEGERPKKNIFQVALEHTQLYQDTYAHHERYSFLPMRKHLGWYVRSIPNAKEVRRQLFQTNTTDDVKHVFLAYNLL